MKIIYVSAAVLVNKKGDVLLCERPEGKDGAGKWEFPGGKIEAGETPEEALAREMQEELCIDINIETLTPFVFSTQKYPEYGYTVVMLGFKTSDWRGDIQATEHDNMAWVPQEDLGIYKAKTLPADIPFFERLMKESTTTK